MSSIMPRTSIFLAIAAVNLWGGVPARLVADEKLDYVISSLKTHERLFSNLEVRWHETYRSFKDGVDRATRKKEDFDNTRDVDGWSVDQNGLFFLKYSGEQSVPPQYPQLAKVDLTKAYDGDASKILEWRGAYVGNLIEGRTSENLLLRPHAFPLRDTCAEVSLSEFLSGHMVDETGSGAEATWADGLELHVRYGGEESVDGLECHRVTIEYYRFDGNKVSDRLEVWLTPERTWLPIKTVGYNYYYSTDLPIQEFQLEDLREIEPGIWFPFHARTTVYSQMDLAEHRRQVLKWYTDYVVESVSLKPDYDIAFFRGVTFPEETLVYQVGNNGKVQGGRIEGETNPLAPAVEGTVPISKPRYRWLLSLNVVLFTALGAWLGVRRYRRRNGPPAAKPPVGK